jgi:hypothetical protein
MAGIVDPPHGIRIGTRHRSHKEESRLDAFRRQRCKHAVGIGGQRPVVEGEDHFLVRERQRLGILHRADAGVLNRIDHQNARRADRMRVIRALAGLNIQAGQAGQQTTDNARDVTHIPPRPQGPLVPSRTPAGACRSR